MFELRPNLKSSMIFKKIKKNNKNFQILGDFRIIDTYITINK